MSPQPVFLLRLQPDARLVRLARRGHAEAFEAIVLRYRGTLLAYCRRLLRGDAAQDVAQETFIRAWQALEQGTEVRELRAWLFTIAHRLALREIAARRAQPEELGDAPSSDPCPAAEFERRASVGQVLSAVAALPEDQRDALVWTEMEGRSRRDIAAQLGVSEGAVRQLVYRARGALRAAAMAITPGPLLVRVLGRSDRQPLIEEFLAGSASHAVPATVGTVAAVVVAASLGAGAVTAPDGDAGRPTESPAKPSLRAERAKPLAVSKSPPTGIRRAARQEGARRSEEVARPPRRPTRRDGHAGPTAPPAAETPAQPPPEQQFVESGTPAPDPVETGGDMDGGDAAVKPAPEPKPKPVDPPAAEEPPPSNYVPAENNVPPPSDYVPPENNGGDYVPDEGPAPDE